MGSREMALPISREDDSGNKSATSSVANFTMANGSGDSPRGVRLKGGRLRGGVRLK